MKLIASLIVALTLLVPLYACGEPHLALAPDDASVTDTSPDGGSPASDPDAEPPDEPEPEVPFDPIDLTPPPDTEAPIACGETTCGDYQACHTGVCACLPGYVETSAPGEAIACAPGELACLRATSADRFVMCYLRAGIGEYASFQDQYFAAVRTRGDSQALFDSRGASSAFGVSIDEIPLVGLDDIGVPEGTCWGRIESVEGCGTADASEWCEIERTCHRSAFHEASCNSLPGCSWTPSPPPAPIGCGGFVDTLECRADRRFRSCIDRATGEPEYRFEDGRVLRSRFTAFGFCFGLTDEPVDGMCTMVDPEVCAGMSEEDCFNGTNESGVTHACNRRADGTCFGTTSFCAQTGLTPEICNSIPGCAFQRLE